MIWVVQNALFGDEHGHESFTAAIKEAGERCIQLDYTFWDMTVDLKLANTNAKDVLPFGTRSFVCYGRKNGWCVYWDVDFQYSSLLALGEDFVNHDMQIGPLDQLKVPDTGKVFIREASGFNIIKGKVISGYSWPACAAGFKRSADDVNRKDYDWHPIEDDTVFAWAPGIAFLP
jgi:hypothetical protein